MILEELGVKYCDDGGEGEDNNVMFFVLLVMFLYYLVNGVVVRSYGLNVVCLVGILNEIINIVVVKL